LSGVFEKRWPHLLSSLPLATPTLSSTSCCAFVFQEEIRFFTAPELQVAMLFNEPMGRHEAIQVCGYQTYSRRTGYDSTLKYNGPAPSTKQADVSMSFLIIYCCILHFVLYLAAYYTLYSILLYITLCTLPCCILHLVLVLYLAAYYTLYSTLLHITPCTLPCCILHLVLYLAAYYTLYFTLLHITLCTLPCCILHLVLYLAVYYTLYSILLHITLCTLPCCILHLVLYPAAYYTLYSILLHITLIYIW